MKLNDVPVVLFIYKRPDTTRKVINVLQTVKPGRVMVVGDGPRPDMEDDKEQVTACRDLVENVIDWDCELQTEYARSNLGLRKRISSGLDWVFEQTSEAIILEDDCVPHPSFFRFCTELLEKYRDDERIMTIGGTNYQFGRNRTPHSYYFSIYPHIWGWATWKRAWKYYDNDMLLWSKAREEKYLDKFLTSKKAVGYWRKCFDRVYNGKIDSWAYVWTYSSWMNNGLTILPSGNLVSNIGVGMQATHTVGKRNPYLFMPQNAIEFPLMHPPEVVRNITADEFTQNTVYRTRLLAPIKHEIKKLLVSLGFME